MSVHEITTTKLSDLLTKNEIVALDFWAPWCAPCKALTPVLEELEKSHPEVKFCKINADSELGQELGEKFSIASLPTMLLFKDGKKLRNLIGNTSKAKIEAFFVGA